MSDAQPTVIYLEPDDEITTVVRRLRETDAPRVILVAPGRTRATTSALGLRLLAAIAREDGRELVLVTDAAARSLAAEAGLAAVASIADARALRDASVEPAAAVSGARISVARGSRTVPPVAAMPSSVPPAATADASLDETRAVPVARPAASPPSRPRDRRRLPVAVLGAAALLLVGAVVAGAVLLPAATIRIARLAEPLGPFAYELTTGPDLAVERDSGEEPVRATGTATGIREVRVNATGTVILQNWNTVAVEVGAGTQVAAGEIVFTTDATVVVPAGGLTGDGTIAPGTESVGVMAVEPGPAGNVAAEAIDTMLTEPTASRLRGFPNSQLRVVINPEVTAGGASEDVPVVQQSDIDAVLGSLDEQLAEAVAAARTDAPGRLYLEPLEGDQVVDVAIPDDLLGREDVTSFELTGTLRWTIEWLDREAVEQLARERLATDTDAVRDGHELVESSVQVTIDPPARDANGARVPVHVTATTALLIDADAVRSIVVGLTPDEAEAALAGIGPASVELWPGWVERVPTIAWRVSVLVEADVAPGPSARGSAAP